MVPLLSGRMSAISHPRFIEIWQLYPNRLSCKFFIFSSMSVNVLLFFVYLGEILFRRGCLKDFIIIFRNKLNFLWKSAQKLWSKANVGLSDLATCLQELCEHSTRLTRLQELDLSGNMITSQGLSYLSDAVEEGKFKVSKPWPCPWLWSLFLNFQFFIDGDSIVTEQKFGFEILMDLSVLGPTKFISRSHVF